MDVLRTGLAGVVLALSFFIETNARAEPPVESPPSRIVVLPVDGRGVGRVELPDNALDDARNAIVDVLDGRGQTQVLDAVATDAAVDEHCEDVECLRRLAKALDVDFVVRTDLVLGDGEFSVEVGVTAREPGPTLGPFRQECPICGQAELDGTVRAAAIDALIAVVNTRLAAPLAPPPSPSSAKPPSRMKIAGFSLIGAGAAATVGGVVLLSLHQRAAGCVQDPRIGECLPLRYTTTAPGASVLGVGLTMAATGVGLVIAARRGGKARSNRRVSLSPWSGAALRF